MSECHARPIYVFRSRQQDPAASPQHLYRILTIDPEKRDFLKQTFTLDQLLSILGEFSTLSASDDRVEEPRYPLIEPAFGTSANPAIDEGILRQLSATMYGDGQTGEIPAGYTYFLQFVAHEMCKSMPIGEIGSAQNAASFALDLSSVYKAAPKANNLELSIGRVSGNPPRLFDIKRHVDGTPWIGNDRNDSNLALSQFHCAVKRFHNTVARTGRYQSFKDVQEQVTLSFQSIVLENVLPALTSQKLVDEIRHSRNRYWPKGSITLCPAEAVMAGLRCGHSMVRTQYNHWNSAESAAFEQLLSQTSKGGGLDTHEGETKLRNTWPLDWARFFKFSNHSDPLMAKKIDTKVAFQFEELPSFLFKEAKDETALAYRTLWFGNEALLHDGWTIQEKMQRQLGQQEFFMTTDDIPTGTSHLAHLFKTNPVLGERPPLWWFILRESEVHDSGRGGLVGVGARLVAETIIAAIEAATPSILNGGRVDDDLPGGKNCQPSASQLIGWNAQPINWFKEIFS